MRPGGLISESEKPLKDFIKFFVYKVYAKLPFSLTYILNESVRSNCSKKKYCYNKTYKVITRIQNQG